MVTAAIHADSSEQAIALLEEILAQPDHYAVAIAGFALGEWASVRVHVPAPNVKSAITPPFMEAFLEVQKQLYQLAAMIKTGAADAGQLNEIDRQSLEITVYVSGGSSDYIAQLVKPLETLFQMMVGKMSGRQSAIVILGIATLFGAGWAWSAWLEHVRLGQIEELKSQEHLATLNALSFANEEQSKLLTKIIEVLNKQGEEGKRAVDAATESYRSLLKAASRTPAVTINEEAIARDEAEVLRTSTKRRPVVRFETQLMRVVDINTSDPVDLQLILMEPEGGAQHRIRFTDSLFAHADRVKLFQALDTRDPIWVELAIKEIEGEIRAVQLLRVVEPPPELARFQSDEPSTPDL